jgi:hypothetical protein
VRDRFIRFLGRISQIISDALSKLGGPFWFADIVNDNAQVAEIERDVVYLRGSEDNWLHRGMS